MQTNHPHIYNLDIEQALQAFEASREGLSAQEVAARQKEFGPNALSTKRPSWLKRLLEPFSSIFVGVLLIAAVLSLVEGERVDALIITLIVGANAIIFYAQQFSVSRVLKTLKEHDASYAHTLRDGKTVRVPIEELTYGDIVRLEEGMKVPADGRLIEANQIQVDEALLTGESLPVHKHAGAINGEKRVYDQQNMVFKGTYIKAGTGQIMITGIGNQTELGSITTLASQADVGRSPIERKIDSFTKRLMLVILCVAALALALALYRGIGLEEALRFCLIMIVAVVPEGLPVALTIVLLLSARRMAKVKALVKKISSIETMGAITMIATDKTGTITQNNLSVADKHTIHGSAHIFDEVIRASLNGEADHASDPLDKILFSSVPGVVVPPTWRKVKEFPFNQQLRASGTLWQHHKGFSLYLKGAPEHILERCGEHHSKDGAVMYALDQFTGRGYRTIAFAHKDFAAAPAKLDHQALSDMVFDGFVGMADQLRPKVAEAVAEAHRAGIKVIMLTGDHVNTAGYIARQVGIAATSDQVSDSTVLEDGSPEDVRDALRQTRVFGRVLPEHKYALLKATKHSEITAMTGDGVNDIPALVEADAGIAMGSGTEAAKDASDIVLLDSNFHTIVSAIRVGRTALANVHKMLMYLLGTTSGFVITILLALVMDIPLPMVAIQILWINLVTDGVVVIPLGLSPSEPRQMQAKPRHPNAPLLNVRQVTRILTMAVTTSVVILVLYRMNLDAHGHAYAQTLAFMSFIVVQWANAFNVNFEYRSWVYNFIKPNWKLWAAILASIGLQLAIFLTFLGQYLAAVPVDWRDALVSIVVPVAAVLLAVDLHKLVFHFASRRKERRLVARR